MNITDNSERVYAPVIGPEQLKDLTNTLQKYKAGKSQTERRIIAAENWWKLRNAIEERKETNIGADGGFKSVSGWLHNVITSKHADAIEAFPEPNILPREEGDRAQARMLSAIIPCILEQNKFEDTYDDCMWQKMKFGTCVYKVIWDKDKLNGLGDIGVERVNLLNLFWEPGITDIQKSRYLFHTELIDKDILESMYPEQLKGGIKGQGFMSTKFLYDDHVDTENKATVIDVYYHKYVGGKNTLQYIKYVNDVVLYATEDDNGTVDEMTGAIIPGMAQTGLYDHGRYPYVFDALFPVEGSPCGYGYVDICRNPQTEIDLIKTSIVKNAMVGSVPRYFSRGEKGSNGINEEEFLDLSNPIVHATDLSDNAIRPIDVPPLNGNYLSVLDQSIQELRETSGNTEASTGTAPSSVTAASAIAALQTAAGKGSRSSTMSAYRAYGEIVEICIELIRQFYNAPRQFRILGQYGAEQFVSYSNAGLQEQYQGNDLGTDQGFRLPVFDIKISAQKKNAYTKMSQNELAIQFFQLGFFNPQMTDQALMCLEMMDFDGKDGIMQKVAQNGAMYQKLTQYMQIALALAQTARPELAQSIAQDMAATMGQDVTGLGGDLFRSEHGGESSVTVKAREQSAAASQPV